MAARQRPEDAQRHHQHYAEGHRPALIQGCQTQEDEEYRDGVQQRRLVARQALLVAAPRPFVTYAWWHGAHQFLHHQHRGTRADAGRNVGLNLVGRAAVVAHQLAWAVDPAAAGEGAERHHLATAVAHVPVAQAVRVGAVGGLALYQHALDAPAVDEVVDITSAHRNRQRVIDRRRGHAQRASFMVVDLDGELRRFGQAVGSGAAELWPGCCGIDKLVARGGQRLGAQATQVLKE